MEATASAPSSTRPTPSGHSPSVTGVMTAHVAIGPFALVVLAAVRRTRGSWEESSVRSVNVDLGPTPSPTAWCAARQGRCPRGARPMVLQVEYRSGTRRVPDLAL